MALSPAPRPVLVTRPAGRGASLLHLLEAQSVPAEHTPLVRLVPAEGEELAAARARLADGAHTHLVVTSRTAAEALGAVAVPEGTVVVAVGGGTAEALGAVGIPATLVAAGSGDALVAQMPEADEGACVLFPASSAASRTVPEGLRAKGYRVHEVTAYRPERLEPPPAVAVALATGGYSALVLTSPMIARQAAAVGVHPSIPIITIGPPTSAAVRAAGLTPAREADETTDEALAAAVCEVLALPSAAPGSAAPGGSTPSAGPGPQP